MKTHLKLLMSGTAVSCMMLTAPALAQTSNTNTNANEVDEIVVTARKREESLTEVPVSISVLGESLIEDTGILTQQDLFDLVPGIQFDAQIDRNSASPSIRGVQTDEIATNRTKVTQFIDGMPVLGSQGNIQFGSVQQVEVFRGPQSAAFGRSTFGGAINYVTKDPGDEFEADALLEVTDYGTFRIGGSVGGPITDTLGFRADVQIEDSTSPGEFEATDGTQWGERSSEAYSGKLVWEPTDRLTAELSFSHVESDDEQAVQYFISEDAYNDCFDGVTVDDMGAGVYADGQLDCDWSQGAQIVSQADRVPAVQAAIDAGVYGVLTDEEVDNLLFLADAESLTDDLNGAKDERDRIALQVDYEFGNGAIAQLSTFYGTEEYIRVTDTNQDNRALTITLPGGMSNFYEVVTGGPTATVGGFMADPSEIVETYVEARYVSPGDDRLRYVAGVSYYDYTFETNLYFNGYKSVVDGTTDRYDELVGNTAQTSLSIPTQIFQETATNAGVFGNVSYDITDRLTATLEARYQRDEAGGTLSTNGVSASLVTEAFLPRLSVNYELANGNSVYAQYARGNNPAGANVGFFDETLSGTLDCAAFQYSNDGTNITSLVDGVVLTDANGDPVPYIAGQESAVATALDGTTNVGALAGATTSDFLQLAPNSDTPCGQNFVDYTSDQVKFFQEETIDNYEIGFKGRALDGDLTFAAAAFYMDWQDQGRTVNLDWADPNSNGMADYDGNRTLVNEGDIVMKGVEFEGSYNVSDSISVRGQFSYLDAEYADYCDLNLAGGGYIEEVELTRNAEESGVGYTCVDVSGKKVVQQAPWTGSISPSFRTEIKEGLSFDARADIRYEGAQYLDTINQWETKPVTTANISSGLTGDHWGLTLYVNNVFDEDQPLRYGSGDDYSIPNALTGEDFTNNYLITPRTQRTVGLRARVNY